MSCPDSLSFCSVSSSTVEGGLLFACPSRRFGFGSLLLRVLLLRLRCCRFLGGEDLRPGCSSTSSRSDRELFLALSFLARAMRSDRRCCCCIVVAILVGVGKE